MLSSKYKILIAVLAIILGISLLGYDYFLSKKNKVYEKMSFELSSIPEEINDNSLTNDNELSDSNEVIDQIENGNVIQTETKPKEDTKPSVSYNYIGYLEIPKIDLKKGFLDIKSKYNDVEKNVAVMKESVFPDVDKSLMVMAAHNGTCWNCYFRNLDKLKNGDEIFIYYQNIKYKYKLIKSYDVNKTGSVPIYRNSSNTTLALVTCKWNYLKEKQTVYIAELISKQNV